MLNIVMESPLLAVYNIAVFTTQTNMKSAN
jgi:hypothetical protein